MRSIFAVTVLLLLVVSAAQGAEFQTERLANGILVTPNTAYQGAAVRLVGPDGTQELQFAANEQIFLPTPSKDGRYQYELVIFPQLNAEQRALAAVPRDGLGIGLGIDGDQNITEFRFAVEGGQIVDWLIEEVPGADKTAAAKDIVHSDDVIINGGSLCVGFDCVNGESFGSDTQRLKENNLRIHFDDTSNSGTFPMIDWRLTANDSTNGGAEYFAVDNASSGARVFSVFNGAGANSLVVDAQGDIGIGTATPVVELQITDGDTPTVRLEQNGSQGFGSQTWDVAGNESNFFVRDVSGGSALSLRVQPGADQNSLTLDNEGQVAIGLPGTGFPESNATLHVRSRNVAGDNVVLVQDSSGGDLLALASTGDMTLTGTLAQLSRRDSKEGFETLNGESLLETLRILPISRWNYIHQPDDQRHLGPMAEDFYAAYGLGTDPEHIATSDMAAVALASTQALLQEIDKRDAHIDELESRIQDLERLMLTVLMEKEQDDSQIASSR